MPPLGDLTLTMSVVNARQENWDLVGIVDGTYIPELCAKVPPGPKPWNHWILKASAICTRGISVRHKYCRDPGTTGKELHICAWERRYGITLTITDAGPELYDNISVMKDDICQLRHRSAVEGVELPLSGVATSFTQPKYAILWR